MVFLNMNQIHQLMQTKKKETRRLKLNVKNQKDKQKNQKKSYKIKSFTKRHYKINKNVIFYYLLLVVINIIDKMQKAISNKIQLGETLNPLDDYGGVPSINDGGTFENLIGKVDKAAIL